MRESPQRKAGGGSFAGWLAHRVAHCAMAHHHHSALVLKAHHHSESATNAAAVAACRRHHHKRPSSGGGGGAPKDGWHRRTQCALPGRVCNATTTAHCAIGGGGGGDVSELTKLCRARPAGAADALSLNDLVCLSRWLAPSSAERAAVAEI